MKKVKERSTPLTCCLERGTKGFLSRGRFFETSMALRRARKPVLPMDTSSECETMLKNQTALTVKATPRRLACFKNVAHSGADVATSALDTMPVLQSKLHEKRDEYGHKDGRERQSRLGECILKSGRLADTHCESADSCSNRFA